MSQLVESSFMELRHASTDRPIHVVVPERRFFAIDGIGAPNTIDYALAGDILRRVAHAAWAASPARPLVSSTPLLETIWWQPSLAVSAVPTAFGDRREWHWRQLIETPRALTDALARRVIDVAARAAGDPLDLVRLVAYAEGPAVQLLLVGDADGEPETVGRLFATLLAETLEPSGEVHELRLRDAGTVPAGRGRAIIRAPYLVH
jgi:hypothetical protein